MICFPFLCQLSAPDVLFPGANACTWNCMAPSCPFLRHFGAPDVFFPGAPACIWNCMAPLSSFSPSIWRRPWRFHPWIPCLHLKLHGASLVLFSVNLVPLTFLPWSPCLHLKLHGTLSSFSPSIWRPDVFFPGSPTCIWNCMAPLSSFSPSIWRPWRFLLWSPYFHLKLAWRISRPFSPSIWRPWCFLPWSPYFHLKLHGPPLVLFSTNLAPLTFSSLEPLLALETAWRPLVLFLRQFGAPDVFFPGAPACTWNCIAPLSSFSPSIWRPWRFLPWSPCLHLKLHGAPLVILI